MRSSVSAIPSVRFTLLLLFLVCCDILHHGLSCSLSLSDPLLTAARVRFPSCSCHVSAYKPSVAAHCLQDEIPDEGLKPNIRGPPAWACTRPNVTCHHKAAPKHAVHSPTSLPFQELLVYLPGERASLASNLMPPPLCGCL